MTNHGIGYGQVNDFKMFLKEKGLDFNTMTEASKTEVSKEFLMPKKPTVATKVQDAVLPKPKKPDILSYYQNEIRPLFTVEELSETSEFQVYLTAASRMGWMLEIKLKNRKTHKIPFMTKENCEKVHSLIWKDWLPYAEIKYKEKMNE